MTIETEIDLLKRERNAIILAHNYERSEIQSIADFTGDSLELARKAAQVDSDVIVFCGVYFMAQTAAILNPGKTVLIPDPCAGCAMADMVTAEDVRALKEKHPSATVACYVNSTAEVKAECDICVTSGNAEKILSSLPAEKELIFVPDKNLGGYIAEKLGRKYILFNGCCPIHSELDGRLVDSAREKYPNAEVLVHPECNKSVRDKADHCLSTGGMCAYVKASSQKIFIIGTEVGIMHRLETENPDKTFIPLDCSLICPDMKKVTLENLRDSLKYMQHKVSVDGEIAFKARRSIEAMLELS
jgi:quinolinate synthase